ncbi:MAG: glycosyltransferase [Parvibaculum sp.]|nr:glycosyltransferase [Parvibaculum sp.]
MPLFSRAVEAIETAVRLAAAGFRPTVALERFLAARRPAGLPADRTGIIALEIAAPPPVRVSVVILTLNGGEMLRALFASLAAFNTWPDLEIIVVDHGSDDATDDVLRAASARFHIRHVKPGRNHSFSFSCNRAAQIARGDILLFLNNDIELTEDIMPRIVAGVRQTGGLVGIRLMHKVAGEKAPRPQIGVRFRWNLWQRRIAAYDATPGPRDGLRAGHPCHMPIVTGAVLACDRAQFLKMGGFCEDYLYAYEDVDLGLKAAARFDLPSIALNDISALHLMGATRIKRANLARRRRWHRHSLRALRARFGYRIRRLAWLGLFGADERFDWGRRPAAAVLAQRTDEAANRAARELATEFAEFADIKTGGFMHRNLFGYDLILSRLSGLPLACARNLSPMALSIAWIRAGDDDWRANADAYDILLADDAELASRMTVHLGRPVIAIGECGVVEALRAAVSDFLRSRFRFAVLAPEGQKAAAAAISAALSAAGHSVRTTVLGGDRRPVSMRDDVVIWLAPPGEAKWPVDAIHVAAFDAVPGDSFPYDVQAGPPGGNVDAWLGPVLAEIGDCDARRMAGLEDLPLEDMQHLDDGVVVPFWRGRPDPTAHLTGAS